MHKKYGRKVLNNTTSNSHFNEKRVSFRREVIAGLTDNAEISRSPSNLALVWDVILKTKHVLSKQVKVPT